MDTRINNTDIIITAHNIKEILEILLESFKLYYPELINNIVVFDDNSTDRTDRMLEKKGIRRITWEDDEYKEKADYLIKLPYFNQSYSSRVSLIYNSSIKQTNKKYGLFIDGDCIILKRGFIEQMFETMGQKENLLVITDVKYNLNEIDDIFLIKSSNKTIEDYFVVLKGLDRFKAYKEHIKIVDDVVYNTRVLLNFSIVNLEYLRKHNIEIEDSSFEYLILNDGRVLDTGSDFYKKVSELNIEYVKFKGENVIQDVIHFGSVSSWVRLSEELTDNKPNEYFICIPEFRYREILSDLKYLYKHSELDIDRRKLDFLINKKLNTNIIRDIKM